jgi:cytochrome P450
MQAGDLVYVKVLGDNILILNDMESMRELFEKRSQKYSDRPSFLMAKYMGIENVSTCSSALYCSSKTEIGQNLAFAPYGPGWRQGRKLVHGILNQEAVKKHHSLQENVTARFLRDLVEHPSEVMKHLHM